jgi:hypothetical protein
MVDSRLLCAVDWWTAANADTVKLQVYGKVGSDFKELRRGGARTAGLAYGGVHTGRFC